MRIRLLENRRAEGWAVFGGYWPRGTVREESFHLAGEKGGEVPLQSEIAARWPDGSVKWSRHLARADKIGGTGELKSGKTVIQHIYDTHFQGYEEALEMERLFGVKVNLQCWVKVKEDWRNRQGLLDSFGYRL